MLVEESTDVTASRIDVHFCRVFAMRLFTSSKCSKDSAIPSQTPLSGLETTKECEHVQTKWVFLLVLKEE